MSFTLRALLFKLHLYVGIAVGVYLAILGVTGAILAFQPEIDRLAHAKLAYVKAAPPRLSLGELGEAVAKLYPDQKIFGYEMGEAPDLSTIIRVGAAPGPHNILVYIDPYTGRILGNRTDGPDLLSTIAGIHVALVPPRPGHGRLATSFVSWITVAALFVLLSGIWLWWPRLRFGIGSGGGRRFWYDLHVTSGIAAAIFLVLLAGSGIVMGFGRTTLPMLYELTGSKPISRPKIPPPRADATRPIPVDQAFAIGRNALPGAMPLGIFGPTPQGVYFVVARAPGDHDPVARSGAFIDGYTGALLSAQNLDKNPGMHLWDLNRAIHLGRIFGNWSKAIMAAASLLVALQLLSGAAMWIKRVSFRPMIPALVATAAVTAIAVYTVLAPNRI